MNPPAALQGAMGRERKPFTYTPGGLDLSEIKSERMAKRLMRNAMSEGVPERPAQIKSPPTPSAAMAAVPNFNCLPVQVFPSFQLPANPKSLLRTRSTPSEHKEPPSIRKTPLTPTPSQKCSQIEHKIPEINNNYTPKPQQPATANELIFETNNNKASTAETQQVNNSNLNNLRPAYKRENAEKSLQINRTEDFGINYNNKPVLPEISYDAEYFEVKPRMNLSKKYVDFTVPIKETNDVLMNIKASLEASPLTAITKDSSDIRFDNTVKSEEDAPTDEDEKRGVRIIKKKKVESQSQKVQKVENGDAEAELTVQLPAKKSSAKTETKVEVSKKSLPDGSTEEIKTTTTRTTIDGKTEIKTKTEKTIIPKVQEVEEEVEEEEEEEEEETGDVVVQEINEKEDEDSTPAVVEMKTGTEKPDDTTRVIKNEERSESTSTTTKRVVIQESSNQVVEEEEDEEEEIEEVEEPVVTVENQTEESQITTKSVEKDKNQIIVSEETEEEVEESKEEEETIEKVESTIQLDKSDEEKPTEEEVEEEEEYEEAEADEVIESEPKKETLPAVPVKEQDEESEYTEEEYESEVEEVEETSKPEPETIQEEKTITSEVDKSNYKEEIDEEKKEEIKEEEKEQPKPEIPLKEETQQDDRSEELPKRQIPMREPSIPLEKVEDVEIKPIGGASETIKTVRETTEIIKKPSDSSGLHSTQEYNRIENIVTVNRTTKTLDNTYEQLTQQGVPTLKTYFAPERERVSTSPQPSKAYEPIYSSQPEPERRHSLLLDRLSTERQMPSELYQNHCINREQQRQWSQEPQSEVVNDSNVKPSSIAKNSQWYQQTKKEHVTYNNVSSTQSAQHWNVPPTQPPVQSQPIYQQTQPAPQPPPQTLYQQPPAPQHNQTHHQFQQPQPQYQQHQSSYSDNSTHVTSDTNQLNSYPSYTPKPSNWTNDNLGSTVPYLGTQHTENTSYLNKNTSESYNKSSQQYSSSYVPPPWEQDPSYVAPALNTQTFYQQPATTPNSQPAWQVKPAAKLPKPTPTAYIPPAPNQSFVKPINNTAEFPKVPGRKTYYSEYERRYISVPEATYVPGDNKMQPDPSPQYYYDTVEPKENVEHEWRKELREFTEKSSQTQPEQTSVRPPWETDINKYAKAPAPAPYTPTPSWSQTLRPQSMRERSFESEFATSNEWSKTNTVGRGRPLSTYGNLGVETIPEARPARGVSVDRYNPNSYQSPLASEHAPVPTHTLNPPVRPHAKGHHPHVPGYHARAARASAEPRDQGVPAQHPRNWTDQQRHSPIQSRSFKYLQWITGTDE